MENQLRDRLQLGNAERTAQFRTKQILRKSEEAAGTERELKESEREARERFERQFDCFKHDENRIMFD